MFQKRYKPYRLLDGRALALTRKSFSSKIEAEMAVEKSMLERLKRMIEFSRNFFNRDFEASSLEEYDIVISETWKYIPDSEVENE